MTKLKSLLRLLGDCARVCMPDYWTMNCKYDESWNRTVNDLMANFEFDPPPFSDYTAMLGMEEIWVGNHPYASFTPHRDTGGAYRDVRPSRLTIVRARRKFLKDRALWDDKKKARELLKAATQQVSQFYSPGLGLVSATQTGLSAAAQTFTLPSSGSFTLPMTTLASQKAISVNAELFKDRIRSLKDVEAKKVTRPVPDYVHTLVGWRGWVCRQGKLEAMGVSGLWNPKQVVAATCVYNGNHAVPCKDCSCGYWSFKSLDLLLQVVDPYADHCAVVGSVEVWGRVIDCENGYRSEFAYPKELWLLQPNLDFLGPLYGVPVKKYVDSNQVL